jgi:hypothetical protein
MVLSRGAEMTRGALALQPGQSAGSLQRAMGRSSEKSRSQCAQR